MLTGDDMVLLMAEVKEQITKLLLSRSIFAFILVGVIVYVCYGAVYRLYMHPLRKFPGPKLGALSFLYEFYYNVVLDGMFIWELERLHKVYGPIVRINPDELHIQDPNFYDQIYAGGSEVDKYPRFNQMFSAPKSTVAIADHTYHRFRRGLVGEFFSRRSIVAMESVIKEHIDRLSDRLKAASSLGVVIDLGAAFAAMTADIITCYAYGESSNHLQYEDFNKEWKDAVVDTMASRVAVRHFPILLNILKALPLQIVLKLNPGIGEIIRIENRVRKLSLDCMKEIENNGNRRKTIFDALNDPSLPLHERTADHLVDEGHILLLAGTETTAKALMTGFFYISNNKAIYRKLRTELDSAVLDVNTKINWSTIQRLPYLTAVVNESLRLSYGLSCRLPRIAPKSSLQYQQYSIPPGTPVSQSSYFIHMDANIFPNPEVFDPERWIEATKKGERLDKFIVSFTKGSRQCLGINLAYAELYLTFAILVPRFEFNLHETTVKDVTLVRDKFFGHPQDGTQGVRAFVAASGLW